MLTRIALAMLLLAGCATGGPMFEAGRRFASQQNWDEAIRSYEQALKEEPGNPQYQAALAQVKASVADEQRQRAVAAAGSMGRLKDVERALALIEGALRYDPNHRDSQALQAQLQTRRTALATELERLVADGRAAAQRGDWAPSEQAAVQALAIDPDHAVARRLQEDAVRLAAVQGSLRRAQEAESQEDWREAARYLQEALGRDPSNGPIGARYRTARERDNADYYIQRARGMAAEGKIDTAYRYLETAAKYYRNEVRPEQDSLATEGRRRAYTEALRRAETDDWSRVYGALTGTVQVFGPAPRVEAGLRPLVRDLATRIYDRALEFENQKLWGNVMIWLRILHDIDPTYRDSANRVEQTRERVVERATVKIAALEFDSPKSTPDAGAIVSGSIITNLFKLGRKDFKVIERSALQSIIKEISIGQAGVLDVETAKEIGKIAGIDIILLGSVLKYGTEQHDEHQTKTVWINLGFKEETNPAYLIFLALDKAKRDGMVAPPEKSRTEITQLHTYKAGAIKAAGFVSVSFRLVGVERGEVRLADQVEQQEVFTRDYSDGVEGKIEAKARVAPNLNEILNRVTEQAATKIVQSIVRHFQNRAEAYLNLGQEMERRRQFTRAVEEYMSAITAAELENAGQPAAAAARAHVDRLLRQ